MKEIKNLIFDLGVVLVDLDRESCVEAFRQLGVKDVEKMTSLAAHNGIFGQYELGELTTPQFYDGIRNLANLPLTDEEIRDAWIKMVKYLPSYKLDKILELRSQFRIFLLSNTNEIHWNWCAEKMFTYADHTANDFFERCWLSHEIHLCKPDPAIFEYILQDAGINAEETFFLDDAAANCKIANKIGIRTYQPAPFEDWTGIFNY